MRSTIRYAFALCLLPLLGCVAEEEYVGEGGLTAFAVTTDTPPFFEGEEASLYLVEARVELPITPPTNQDLERLRANVGDMAVPWERLPWVRRDDLAIEIDWALTNLTESGARVALVLNGFNEFHEYSPAFVVDDDEVIPDFAQYERDMEIEPFETRTGTIRAEHLDEVAIDLSTVVNGAPNSNQVVYFDSDSHTDPRVQPYIPPIIAGLTGFRLGIRATGLPDTECPDGGCGVLVLEASVRVKDEGDRLASGDDEAWQLPQPALFTPVAAMAEP